jgi:hypothetical protein
MALKDKAGNLQVLRRSEKPFTVRISEKFQHLSPLVRYPTIAITIFFGLFPAIALLYGLLVGVEFTARYSIRQAYCAIYMEEAAFSGSQLIAPAECYGGDSERLADQTVRNVFAAEDDNQESGD